MPPRCVDCRAFPSDTAGMQPGNVFADRFEIERFAGVGGLGRVYRVLARKSGSKRALKGLAGEGTAEHHLRFQRQARVLTGQTPPGIVRYPDHGMTPTGE